MKNNFLLSLLILLPFFLLGQQEAVPFGSGPNGVIKCATVENMEKMRSLFPGMETEAEFETWLQDKIAEEARNGYPNSRVVVTIPVVVHLIHNGTAVGSGLNLPASRVQDQIDVLNEDFRRKVNTPGFNNNPVGADAEIEFCLAFWDPSGMPLAEPGIDRIDRNTKGWTAPPYLSPPSAQPGQGYIERTIKAESIWDPTKYFNIWVTDLAFQQSTSTLLGYAQFPTGSGISDIQGFSAPATSDGIIILHSVFGRTMNFQNGGRTVTHEAGHWLGLRHIWGDGGCGVDDYCADTPESDDQNFGCNPNHVSCGTTDMVRNYMDYSNGTCQNIFTACQKTRMRTTLTNAVRRASLTTSTVCEQPTTSPVSGFTFDAGTACDGTIQFLDSSQNLPTQWFWSFGDGGTSTRKNPVYAYSTSGTYSVRLIVNNSFGTNSYVRQVNVNVSAAASVDAGPDIVACAGDLVTLNVNVSDPSATVRWSPSQGILNPTSRNPVFQAITGNTYYVTATDSTGCQSTDTLIISVVVKPILNAGADITIQPGGTTNLNASLSKMARSWRWTPVYGFNTVGHDTLPKPSVTPAQTVTYTMTATDVDGCEVTDKVTITVEGTPPLAIDGEFENEIGSINLPYPNPAQREVMFSGDFKTTGELELSLYDLNGKKIETLYKGDIGQGVFVKKWQRNQMISSGLYFVEWRMDGRRVVQKVQLK